MIYCDALFCFFGVCVCGFIVRFLSFVFVLLHCLLPSLRRIKIDNYVIITYRRTNIDGTLTIFQSP